MPGPPLSPSALHYCIRKGWALAGLLFATLAKADDFARIDGELLRTLVQDPRSATHPSLGFREIEAVPAILRDSRSALLIVETDRGNLARLLVSPGFRETPGDKRKMVPVLVIERFETFEAGSRSARLATGRDVMLYSGFQFDLDGGQIVPEGLGGDLSFAATGRDDGRLGTIGKTRLFTTKPPLAIPSPAPGQVSDGKVVRSADFSGKFRLIANGQWKGLLTLTVDPAGAVTGQFRSDSSGTDYPVSGKVPTETPGKIQFMIQFPRTRQDYQGILWNEGKNVMAGTFAMLGRDFSFVAIREGATLDLESEGASKPKTPDDP